MNELIQLPSNSPYLISIIACSNQEINETPDFYESIEDAVFKLTGGFPTADNQFNNWRGGKYNQQAKNHGYFKPFEGVCVLAYEEDELHPEGYQFKSFADLDHETQYEIKSVMTKIETATK